MGPYVIAIAAVAVLTLISISASRALGYLTEIPMQWSLGGKPAWHAPRRVALAFTPTISAILLLAIASKGSTSSELVFAVAMAFVSAHVLHLALVFRKLRR